MRPCSGFSDFKAPREKGAFRKARILRRQVLAASTAVASALRLPLGSEVIRLVRLRFMDEAPVLLEDVWLPKEKFKALTRLEPISFGNLL